VSAKTIEFLARVLRATPCDDVTLLWKQKQGVELKCISEEFRTECLTFAMNRTWSHA